MNIMELSKSKSKVRKKDRGSNGTATEHTKSKGHYTSEGHGHSSTGHVEEKVRLKSVFKRHSSVHSNSDEDNTIEEHDHENHDPESHHSIDVPEVRRKTKHGGSLDESAPIGNIASFENESIEGEDHEFEEEEHMRPKRLIKATRSTMQARKEEMFALNAGSQQPEEPSWVYDFRGYHSEPCVTIPFEQKFTLKAKPAKLKPGMKEIKEKYMSMEDLYLVKTEYPELVTGTLSDAKLRSYAIDESMMTSWSEIFELEKKRFSFFDELFAQGYIVDSMEVPLSGHHETVDYFIEAEEKDFRDKIDYGRVVFKTKHIYTGNFNDWYFQGPGRYVWLDGATYQGEFLQGLMHGKGSIQWIDGCYYEGEFANGTRAGWGVYSTSEGFTFAGDWKNGLPHGQGKMWYDPKNDDGDYYDGEWAEGLQSGRGTRQYANGDRYLGNWSEGERSGSGSMIWLNERQVYKGEWFNGVPQGRGKHIWYLERTGFNAFPSRHIYCGEWYEGKRHGIGKMIYPCGSTYEGRWNNGQRHGKGVFLNPAGGIIMGIFRAGAVTGGTDVPLHAPTYAYDFGGLVEWLTVKFNLRTSDEIMEEDNLADTTVRYLTQLRKLYKRAGMFGYTWGNNGLYPYWMKKSHPRHEHHIPNHEDLDEPQHMKGKPTKPPSPDGINPVTRFGLWLLLKDCAGLTDDVTLAYFDRHFSDTPSISFQTRHNPFEPIYLWQFLQCLVIVAIAVNMEIPEQKRRWNTDDGDESSASSKASTEDIPTNVKSSPDIQEQDSHIDNHENTLKHVPHYDNLLDRVESVEIDLSNDDNTLLESSEISLGVDNVVEEPAPEDGVSKSEEASGEYIPYNKRPKTFNLSICEAFETFLIEKLIPCLDREAGVNLPQVPSPLPPLRDLYDSFKDIKGRDWLTATEFMQDSLPHKVSPNLTEAIFWHRSPEILSTNVDLQEMFSLQRDIQHRYLEAEMDDGSVSLGAEYVGSTTHVPSKSVKNAHENFEKSDGVEEILLKNKESVANYVTDPTPFSENDLPAEAFLWEDEPKCRRVERHQKHYQNLNTHDVLNALRFLYPKLVGHVAETNVDFDMIFCDWLWAVSLNAKVSADREFRSAMKSEKEEVGHHNHHHYHPHSHNASQGVFAHHVKQIRKNNLIGPMSYPVPLRSQAASVHPSAVGSTSTIYPAARPSGKMLTADLTKSPPL